MLNRSLKTFGLYSDPMKKNWITFYGLVENDYDLVYMVLHYTVYVRSICIDISSTFTKSYVFEEACIITDEVVGSSPG